MGLASAGKTARGIVRRNKQGAFVARADKKERLSRLGRSRDVRPRREIDSAPANFARECTDNNELASRRRNCQGRGAKELEKNSARDFSAGAIIFRSSSSLPNQRI